MITADLNTGPIAAKLRQRCHPSCIACGEGISDGLGLRFYRHADGGVVGHFNCEQRYQGYANRLHGGVIAMLLDAAMTHCLFCQGLAGFTARLNVSYRQPVLLHQPAIIRAFVLSQLKCVCRVRAELSQGGAVKAYAEGKFLTCEVEANCDDGFG